MEQKKFVKFEITKVDYTKWQKFKKALIEDIDEETGRAFSANKKIKQLIEEYTEKKS